MHAISSYPGNRPTNKQINTQTGPITIHCAAKFSAQCNNKKEAKIKADMMMMIIIITTTTRSGADCLCFFFLSNLIILLQPPVVLMTVSRDLSR